jgi:hypothetical protein
MWRAELGPEMWEMAALALDFVRIFGNFHCFNLQTKRWRACVKYPRWLLLILEYAPSRLQLANQACRVESVLSFVRLVEWHMLPFQSGFLNSRHLRYFF